MPDIWFIGKGKPILGSAYAKPRSDYLFRIWWDRERFLMTPRKIFDLLYSSAKDTFINLYQYLSQPHNYASIYLSKLTFEVSHRRKLRCGGLDGDFTFFYFWLLPLTKMYFLTFHLNIWTFLTHTFYENLTFLTSFGEILTFLTFETRTLTSLKWCILWNLTFLTFLGYFLLFVNSLRFMLA